MLIVSLLIVCLQDRMVWELLTKTWCGTSWIRSQNWRWEVLTFSLQQESICNVISTNPDEITKSFISAKKNYFVSTNPISPSETLFCIHKPYFTLRNSNFVSTNPISHPETRDPEQGGSAVDANQLRQTRADEGSLPKTAASGLCIVKDADNRRYPMLPTVD